MKAIVLFGLSLVLAGGLFGCASTSTDWQVKAATVSVGMTRAEVDAILPEWSSPGSNPDLGSKSIALRGGRVSTTGGHGVTECYWVSEHQRVVVTFDSFGGPGSSNNRVALPVKVYQSDYGTTFGTTNGTTYGTAYGTNWSIREP